MDFSDEFDTLVHRMASYGILEGLFSAELDLNYNRLMTFETYRDTLEAYRFEHFMGICLFNVCMAFISFFIFLVELLVWKFWGN